ncbi:MAG: Crp/Fnr family transcriptional regulator [Clostridiales bacterium]|jgi:CRP-like cAMP-binding protein|nr:Crp/Fnr family transcriptional regulator [Eubacteriales bacterium]MDH7565641.1 Crp/Fnr family transcriptional regulator [Clostridiales bacterium]
MNSSWLEVISKSTLFKGVAEEEIPRILDCLNSKVVDYKKNEYVALADEVFNGVGLVLNGEVAVIKENYSGSRTFLAVFKKGDLVGEIIAFYGENKWPATVLAQSDCTIMYIHPEKILDVCDKVCSSHKALISNMVRIISKKAFLLNRKVEYLTIKSMNGKLSKYLLEQYKKAGSSTFTIPLNREELADFLNVSRPSMSRELCKMRDSGIIDFYRESIRIINPVKLEEMLE